MKILSWNIRGLGGSHWKRKRSRLRQELNKGLIAGQIDFLLIQEHHFNARQIDCCGSLLKGDWQIFWAPGYGSSENQGGICIAVHGMWKSCIVRQEILIPGRAQVIVVKEKGVEWGLLNLYAPNHSSSRAQFWESLLLYMPNTIDHWIIGGDFNMLEDPSDRIGGSFATIHGRELAAWERLIFKLRVVDVWQAENFHKMKDSLRYSRTNKGNGMVNMASSHDLANMSRIDRFYVSDNFCDKGGKHGIMPGTILSDHSPVILTIKSESKTMQIQMRVPEALLMDSQYSGEVERIWINQMEQAGNILEKVTQALEHISSFFKEQAKLSYEVYVTRERNIRRAVVSLQRLQERHPESRWVAEHLAQAKQTVTEIESKRGEFNFHYQKSRWSKTGDRCTKEFFDKVRPRKLNSGIRQLRKEDGTITEDPGEMRTIATKYFSQLLKAEETTLEILN